MYIITYYVYVVNMLYVQYSINYKFAAFGGVPERRGF